MRIIVAAFALAIATPAAAAQPADDHAGHRQGGQHQGHGQGQHQGHGQGHGQGQGQGHGQGQHQGQGETCPCCAPGRDGQRPACCERMDQQHGGAAGEPRGAGHDRH